MFTFHYQLTEDEVVEYRLCLIYTTPAYRKKMMMNKYFRPVIFIGEAIFIGFLLGHFLIVYALSAVMSIGWIAFYGKLMERNIRKSIKMMKESGKVTFAVDTQAVYDEEKFVTITKDAEMSTNYSAIEKIIVGPNALYLHENAVSTIIVPYRLFASEEQKEAFIQFIKQKTNAVVVDGVAK